MQDAMGKVNKFSSAAIKKLGPKKSNKHLSAGGQDLAEIVREATAKTLNRPDPELNQQVVDIVGSTVHSDGPRAVAKVLTDRLDQKNPHKVWLAIMLIREVLQKAMKELGPAREDIMAEVERVASAPIDRFDKNLRDQQSTKHAAFELLKMYGHDGHILSQPQQEREADDRKEIMQAQKEREVRAARPKPDTMQQVKEEIQKLDNQNALLQDLLVDKTPFQSKSPGDQALAKEILLDAQKMGQTFERLLGQLSSDERPEAQALMQQALEKMDLLNNSLELHKEAIKSQAERITGKPYSEIKGHKSKEGRTPRKAAEPETSLIDFQDQPAPAPTTQASQYSDPFAASTASWQSPQGQQNPQYNPQQSFPQAQHQNQPQPSYPTSGLQNHSSQVGGQNPFGNQDSQQPSTSGQQNPYQQGPYNQGSQNQQQPLGFYGSHGPQQGQPQYPPYGYGYGYGGYGQQIPNYGQPYGQQPPNYGQPYSQPPQFANPYENQNQQWGGQQNFGRPPQQTGFGGLQPSNSYSGSQNLQNPPLTSSNSGVAAGRKPDEERHEIPIITADIVLKEPSRRASQPTSAQPAQRVESVAASLPVTEVAKPEDVGFGESSFGESAFTSNSASPVPPKTPASTPATVRPSASSTSPNSAERQAQPTAATNAPGNFGFDTTTFGGPSEVLKPAQSQAQNASTTPSSFAPQTAAKSTSQPAPAAQADSDWDLFFTERTSKPEANHAQAGNMGNAFGNMSLNAQR